MRSSSTERDFDLVLVGSTGYVGRLAADHLSRHVPTGTRVALAGRSLDRLEAVRRDLGSAASSWPLLALDVHHEAAVGQVAGRARVVVTTVGPYRRHGLALLGACAAAGTDYVDLTGESLFVKQAVEDFHAVAERTGARLVPSCGFDSVPSDLGVGLTADQARADGAGELVTAILHVGPIRGGLSGGTVDSLRQQLIEVGQDRGLRRVVGDPELLVGPGPRPARPPEPRRAVRRDGDTGSWQAPFVMGGYNRQIVLRSRALSGPDRGAGLSYHEVVDTGSGPLGALAAAAVLAGSTVAVAGLSRAGSRRLLDRVLPDPGQGPSERTRNRGRFRVQLQAVTSDGSRYRTTIAAPLDPGYGATAVMLGQSALALAQDDLPTRGGVLTPMVALGQRLASRLRGHGFTVRTERV